MSTVGRRLLEGHPLTVAFLNDTGFVGGAGIAHRRQVQSFLAAGHNVGAVCCLENRETAPLGPRGATGLPGNWLGLRSLPDIHRKHGLSDAAIGERIVAEIASLSPDLVVTGNLHWAEWPVDVLAAIADAGLPVISYLHDCHWLTGRCAYTDGCPRYLTGCDENCPTAAEYPSANPLEIRGRFEDRRTVFVDRRVPMLANSSWMQRLANAAFVGKASVGIARLGLDDSLFSPIDKTLARRLLGLPEDGTIVLAGAVDLKEKRKGGPFLKRLFHQLSGVKNTRILTFGWRSGEFRNVTSMGHVTDERIMPVIYSAADVLVHTALEESFGQTLMEAAACGLPIVSFRSGGMTEIARHEVNALTVAAPDEPGFLRAVSELLADPARRRSLGEAGRSIVENEYSLQRQYDSWHANMIRLSASQS